jgi:integrase
MATGTISKRIVDACQPGDRQELVWDTTLKGFGLLVMPSGVKSYVYQYRIGGRAGRTRRYTIGRHGSPWTPEKARKRAEDLAVLVKSGVDPIDAERGDRRAQARAAEIAVERERQARELAFRTYADRFVEDGLRQAASDRTRSNYRGMLRNHVIPVLADRPLPEISRADVVRVLDRIPSSQSSVRHMAFAIMRKLFNWARSRGDIEASPLDGMEAPQPLASRDRFLSDGELTLALRAAEGIGSPFGPYYRLLFATGQRREEVAGMKWEELDRKLATWTLPGARTKNSEANIVPLTAPSIAMLDRLADQQDDNNPKWPRKGLVFTTTGQTPLSGFSRAKGRLDAKMLELAKKDAEKAGEDPAQIDIPAWRLHDARRTLATALQKLGVRFEVTEAVLNHTSGAKSGVAGVYQRHNWAAEKRIALEAWSNHCDRLLDPPNPASNVVKIGRRKNSPG